MIKFNQSKLPYRQLEAAETFEVWMIEGEATLVETERNTSCFKNHKARFVEQLNAQDRFTNKSQWYGRRDNDNKPLTEFAQAEEKVEWQSRREI